MESKLSFAHSPQYSFLNILPGILWPAQLPAPRPRTVTGWLFASVSPSLPGEIDALVRNE